MEVYLKKAYSLFFKLVLANVLCILISVFLSLLFNMIFSEQIGYEARGYIATEEDVYSDEETDELLYTYYYDDGEDTKKAEYEEQGYTITEYAIYSDISSKGEAVSLITVQLLCMFMLCGFIYIEMWPVGFKDGFAKNPTKDQRDKFKGFKVGLLSIIPNFVFLIFLCILKTNLVKNFSLGVYKILNSTLYSFIDLISNGVVRWKDIEIWQIMLLFAIELIIPIIAQVWYMIGRRGILVTKKLMYKNK